MKNLCRVTQQGDEWFCSRCELRWAFDEDRPVCPFEASVEGLTLMLAKAIAGPRLGIHITREALLELRSHKWSKMLSTTDRQDHWNAAKAVVAELKLLDSEALAEALKKANTL